MLRALVRLAPEQRPHVQLHFAYSSPADAIYGRELGELDPQRQWLAQWRYVSSAGARLTVEHVLTRSGAVATAAEWYICGSAEFKRPLEAALARRGVAQAQIHAEMFSSPRTPAMAPVTGAVPTLTASSSLSSAVPGGERAAVAQIRLADEDRMLAVRPGETLLEALERHGYRPDFSCRAGACGTCRLRLLAGRVSQAGDALSARERAQGYVLSCVAQPVGDVTLASAGSAAVAVGAGTATGAPRQPAARRVSRRVLRWTLAAAAVALFVQTWTVTSQSQAAASGSDGSQPSNSSPCSTNDDSGAVCVAPTATPSGPSNIITGPTYPTPTPSTHSGSSR